MDEYLVRIQSLEAENSRLKELLALSEKVIVLQCLRFFIFKFFVE
jgi:hypothetical protein